MPTCKRCGLDVDEKEQHTFYTWDINHECRHKVTYRAICDAHAFSSPQIGANTSSFLARITGEPCPWCGGEIYGKTEASPTPPAGVEALRLVGDERISHLLAFRQV
jgi:hypothetical protein